MIGTIRKHTQWLWYIIIVAMIVSLVWFFLPNARNPVFTSENPAGNLGTIFGQPVTPQQLAAAEREGRLFFRLRYNQWPGSDEDPQVKKWAEERLFLEAELRQHHIVVTDEAASRYAKQILGVRPEDAMPMDRLNQFVQNELMARGHITFEDFDHFVRDQAGQDYLISLYGMSGKLITAKEAEFFYRRENEPMVVQTVSFPASDYYAQTEPSESELKDYFDKHEADYRVPDQVQVNYVQFNLSNYIAKATQQLGTNINDRVDEVYHQQGPETFKDAKGKTLSQDAAEARIKKEVIDRTAIGLADREAEQFVSDLSQGHDDDHPYTVSNLFALAHEKGLAVRTSPPFDEKEGTPGLDVHAAQLRVLFQLRPNDPDDKERSMLYAPSPLVGTNAAYVCGLAKQIPSRLRTLEEVRAQVIRDCRHDKSIELAKAAGAKFAQALQTGLAEGKTFEAICSAQLVRSKTLPAFALTTESIPEMPDKTEFQELQSAAFTTPVGQSTKFIPSDDGGLVAYVRSRLPVNEAEMEKKMPQYLERMREQRQIAAYEEWFGRQMQMHYLLPASEQQQSQPVS